MGQPICYNCRYRGQVHNSRHSSCQHPRVQDILSRSGDLQMLLDGLINRLRVPIFYPDFHVVCEEHGIVNGWALWPFNFDPHWVSKCSGFEEVK